METLKIWARKVRWHVNGDLLAWLAMALSLLGLWTVSAMSAF